MCISDTQYIKFQYQDIGCTWYPVFNCLGKPVKRCRVSCLGRGMHVIYLATEYVTKCRLQYTYNISDFPLLGITSLKL